MNEVVAKEIIKKYKDFKSLTFDDTIFEFTNDQITFVDDAIYINGIKLLKSAQDELLSRMLVKPSFIENANTMPSQDWSIVVEKLKLSLNGKKFYALVSFDDIVNEQHIFSIVDFPAFPVKPKLNDEIISKICSCLEGSKDAYNLKDFKFDVSSNTFILKLINENSTFSIQSADDQWKQGVQFIFNDISFIQKHLFERLANGAMLALKDKAFKTSIAKKTFNIDSISKIIEVAFSSSYMDMAEKVKEQGYLLKGKEISIFEYYKSLKPFKKVAKKLKLTNEFAEIFNDDVFNQVYGVDVAKQSLKWKQSAKTGLGAYELFNAIAYTSANILNEFLTPAEAIKLQEKIAEVFFTSNFDLDERAKEVNIKFDTSHFAFK